MSIRRKKSMILERMCGLVYTHNSYALYTYRLSFRFVLQKYNSLKILLLLKKSKFIRNWSFLFNHIKYLLFPQQRIKAIKVKRTFRSYSRDVRKNVGCVIPGYSRCYVISDSRKKMNKVLNIQMHK